MGIAKRLANAYLNWRSFTTDRKLLVIESDDWGSRRTDDRETRKAINQINQKVPGDPYIQFDNLGNTEDLSALFEVLQSVKDRNGNSCCLTANTCMANPDFDRIRSEGFTSFYFEPFWDTIRRTRSRSDTLQLWAEGQEAQIFQPQLHGREHLHALAWLAELQAGNKELMKAFELNVWGIPYTPLLPKRRNNLQAALDCYESKEEETYHREWIKEGIRLFEQRFQYRSTTFIPPAYTWHRRNLRLWRSEGIEAVQGIKLQYEPRRGKSGYRRIPHFTGERSKEGISYLVRNAFYEPSIFPKKDWLSETLSGIEIAFNACHPAIIGSHRINFIGSLDEQNRTSNLRILQVILKKVVQKWPEVEFISSDQLVSELEKS